MWTKNFQMEAGFRKGRGIRDQIANIRWIIEKARGFQKTYISSSLAMLNLLTVWITTNCGKFLKTWEYQTILSASWETCVQVKKQQVNKSIDGLVPNWERSTSRLYYHPAYLTYMQSTLREMPGWMNHKLKSKLLGEISITSDMQTTPPLCQRVKKN